MLAIAHTGMRKMRTCGLSSIVKFNVNVCAQTKGLFTLTYPGICVEGPENVRRRRVRDAELGGVEGRRTGRVFLSVVDKAVWGAS